jgi:EAL domain-containing protein (putative c-di-GMP-specific phosphodiesterase class I)
VPVVPVTINVSPIQCREESFPLHVTSTILKYGLNPKLINIEITETTVMQNIETARRSLEVLKDAGIGIHIDDFGTGYSSLSLLKDLPLNHLKIDRSFISKIIQDVGTRQIMEAISGLSAKLHFKTVAEGVETEEQAEILAEIGIDYLQGYYFSRPLSASRLREKLASNKSRSNAWFDHNSSMGASAAS